MPLPFKFQTGSDAPAQPEARLTLRCAGLALAQVTGPREGQADDEVTATGLVEQMVRRSALSRNKTAMFRMRSLTHYTSPPPQTEPVIGDSLTQLQAKNPDTGQPSIADDPYQYPAGSQNLPTLKAASVGLPISPDRTEDSTVHRS